MIAEPPAALEEGASIGVPVEVHGQPMLLSGQGQLEAWHGEDGRPPTLPASAVFELPDEPRTYRLRVQDLPAITIQVAPSDEDDRA